jgi:hypothetical protein
MMTTVMTATRSDSRTCLDFEQTNNWALSLLEPENQMRDVEFPEQALIGECCVESNELKKATIWTTL